MKDQERLMQMADMLAEILLVDVFQEALADLERPPGQRNLDFVLAAGLGDLVAEQPDNVGGIERRGDGDDSLRLRDAMCGGQHRGAAEAVPDQDRRSGE